MDYNKDILDYQKDKQNLENYLASRGNRFANYLLDGIGVYIFLIPFIFLIDTISEEIFSILIIPLYFGYWVLFEYFLGKTPAKFITKTKVVTTDGYRPSFGTMLGRTLCRLIPFEAFSFLGLHAVGWHDSISGTRVVYDGFEILD